MRLDLYQAETERIAQIQSGLLDEAYRVIASGRSLTPLEESGVLHALQVLIENAIGKTKQWLKARGQVVPTSAYDAFSALAKWNAFIGIRNRIVHDYMNVEMERIHLLLMQREHLFIVAFLMSK